MSARTDADIEAWCEVMHDAYEAAAVGAGWQTQQASRKPWADVPEANKATMRAAVRAVAPAIVARAKTEALRDMADDPRVTCTKCATELNGRADHLGRGDEIEAGR